jgi:hypothetical protein
MLGALSLLPEKLQLQLSVTLREQPAAQPSWCCCLPFCTCSVTPNLMCFHRLSVCSCASWVRGGIPAACKQQRGFCGAVRVRLQPGLEQAALHTLRRQHYIAQHQDQRLRLL